MVDLNKQLAEKEKELEALKTKQSKSFCVGVHTSASYMKFEMEMEVLEDEIAELKTRLKQDSP